MGIFSDDLAEMDALIAGVDQKSAHGESQAAFMKKRAGENPLYRLAADLARGGTQGIRDTVYGAGDLLGDAWEGMGGSPESRDNVITRQKNEREAVFPHMSGSLAEGGARMVGQAAPTMLVPGGPVRTLGGAMKAGAKVGGAEGLIHSDSDELGGKLKDAAMGAGFGAAGSGAFHVPTRGSAVKSPQALAADKAFNQELGPDRISPRISTGKSIGDSPDMGSKATAALGKKFQKGKRAAKVKDLDQRVMDDFAQMELKSAYRGEPDVARIAQDRLHETRDWGAASEIASELAPPWSRDVPRGVASQRRALGRATEAAGGLHHGRFSPQVGGQQGVSSFANLPKALGAHAGQRVEKPGPPPTVDAGDLVPLGAGMVSGHPGLAIAGALPIANTTRKIAKNKRQMKNFQTQSAPFISRVQDLPEIKNSMLGDILTGDAKLQKQYKKLVKAGGGDILEDFINRLAATSLAGTDEQPDGS